MNERGFIMFNRGDETMDLLRDPHAFALLALIAQRARWRTLLSSDGLEIGEAMLGDCEDFGMTRAIYRNRLKKLIRWEQITTRRTNKGTIAKLISSLVFDINLSVNGQPQNHQQDHQRTNAEPPGNHQKTNGEPLTNKGRREEGLQRKRGTRKLSIWEAKERIAAIDKEISDINSDGNNWLYRSFSEGGGYTSLQGSGTISYKDKQIRPEAKARLEELTQTKQETERFLKGV